MRSWTNPCIDHFINYFFLIFHSLLIVFNIFGWIFKKTRKANLMTQTATFLSWYGLGICYGWGFCFCTEWHWQARARLGYTDSSISYIHFLLLEITGISFNEPLVIKITIFIFFICFFASIILNCIDFIKY
ncbi:MAG: DUF2784 domain-containing protein, partial [Spirochaetes bacterium]|nr:DUF2784 domain-containing protein [Spirochaetota bacterium]